VEVEQRSFFRSLSPKHPPGLSTLENPVFFLAGAFVVTTHTPHSFVTHEVLLELFAFGMRADLATIGMAPNV
jgi:hypothetical protein